MIDLSATGLMANWNEHELRAAGELCGHHSRHLRDLHLVLNFPLQLSRRDVEASSDARGPGLILLLLQVGRDVDTSPRTDGWPSGAEGVCPWWQPAFGQLPVRHRDCIPSAVDGTDDNVVEVLCQLRECVVAGDRKPEGPTHGTALGLQGAQHVLTIGTSLFPRGENDILGCRESTTARAVSREAPYSPIHLCRLDVEGVHEAEGVVEEEAPPDQSSVDDRRPARDAQQERRRSVRSEPGQVPLHRPEVDVALRVQERRADVPVAAPPILAPVAPCRLG
mmetsp:Transcript_30968/g.92120  ORF Transcript_30968/g.92120 Transcript_30968/m.92120 type:complete len:279 (-) Transcript_30968:1515-2351(-)